MAPPAYWLDPNDPRAPSAEQWEVMTPEARQRVFDSLPSEVPRLHPPEGDRHRLPKERALEALREYSRRLRRRVYLSSELPVYYPEERMLAPDVIAVLDFEPHPRERWVVTHEGRGLDFALEVHVSGRRTKDLAENVVRYARLGIPEYFVYEPLRARLVGYRLAQRVGRSAPYQPIVPQEGRWASAVLGLDLAMENGRIRFYRGSAALPEAEELIVRLGSMLDEIVTREESIGRELEAAPARRRASHARRRASHARRAAGSASARAGSGPRQALTSPARLGLSPRGSSGD